MLGGTWGRKPIMDIKSLYLNDLPSIAGGGSGRARTALRNGVSLLSAIYRDSAPVRGIWPAYNPSISAHFGPEFPRSGTGNLNTQTGYQHGLAGKRRRRNRLGATPQRKTDPLCQGPQMRRFRFGLKLLPRTASRWLVDNIPLSGRDIPFESSIVVAPAFQIPLRRHTSHFCQHSSPARLS